MMTAVIVPRYDELMWPTRQVLRSLGNSGSVQEIEAKVLEVQGYTDDQRTLLHGRGPQTEIAYRLAWARTYLSKVGAITNSSRGVWIITEAGLSMSENDMGPIPARVRSMTRSNATPVRRSRSSGGRSAGNAEQTYDLADEENSWQDELLAVMLELDPTAFERLSQRILREQGFVSVTVTGRSGDGGIDGTGVLRMNLLSFHMFFQCKRYRGSVSSSAVRDFRGAMVGRSDKGLLITTGHFTPDAVREANRDGAPPVDLVDGEALCAMLKQMNLGVHTEMVERVTVDPDWFRTL